MPFPPDPIQINTSTGRHGQIETRHLGNNELELHKVGKGWTVGRMPQQVITATDLLNCARLFQFAGERLLRANKVA